MAYDDDKAALARELEQTRLELERTRLDGEGARRDRDLLLWLHAEAVWKNDQDTIAMIETEAEVKELTQESAGQQDEIDRLDSSRQAWAEEAIRLQQEKDDFEAPASWDYPHPWKDNGGGDPYYNTKGDCRSCGREFDDEVHDEPFGPPPVLPGPNAPCACPTAEQLAKLDPAFSRPVCTVHPEGRLQAKPYPEDLFPGCPCKACVPADADPWSFHAQMHLCPQCGNKRCPGAANHTNECSGSNAPGQVGSLYSPPAESSSVLPDGGTQ